MDDRLQEAAKGREVKRLQALDDLKMLKYVHRTRAYALVAKSEVVFIGWAKRAKNRARSFSEEIGYLACLNGYNWIFVDKKQSAQDS